MKNKISANVFGFKSGNFVDENLSEDVLLVGTSRKAV